MQVGGGGIAPHTLHGGRGFQQKFSQRVVGAGQVGGVALLQCQADVGAAAVGLGVGGLNAQVCTVVVARAGQVAAVNREGQVATRQCKGECAEAWAAQQVGVVSQAQRRVSVQLPAGCGQGVCHAVLCGQQFCVQGGWHVGPLGQLCQQVQGAGGVATAGQCYGVSKGCAKVLGGQQQGALQMFCGFGVAALGVELVAQVGQPIGLALAEWGVGQQLFQGLVLGHFRCAG